MIQSSQSESQQKFQSQLDRLIRRNELVQGTFQEQLNGIVEEQTAILHKTIEVMKSIEKNLGTSSATVEAILKMVDSLHLAVSALEMIVSSKTVKVGWLVMPVEESAS